MNTKVIEESPRCIRANILYYDIREKYELKAYYYVHFQTNTIWKVMIRQIPSHPAAMD